MPNIFKSFLKPTVSQYIFPDMDEVIVEPPEEEEDQATPEEPAETPAEEAAAPEEEKAQSEASSVISFAKVQADEIVADAKRQGEAILEEYRKRAEEEAAQAREDARAEGYRQGYGEGLRKAHVESQSKLEEQTRQHGIRQDGAQREKADKLRPRYEPRPRDRTEEDGSKAYLPEKFFMVTAHTPLCICLPPR